MTVGRIVALVAAVVLGIFIFSRGSAPVLTVSLPEQGPEPLPQPLSRRPLSVVHPPAARRLEPVELAEEPAEVPPVAVATEAQPTPTPVPEPTSQRITYAPVNGNVLAQMIPRQYPDAECSDTYSENGFPKFRSTRRAVCSSGDAGAAYRQTPWNPGHNAGPPSTIELHNLVKQADGSATIPCTLDSHTFQQIVHENDGWYNSGMPNINAKLRLRSQGPQDLQCTNPIEETAIFIKREQGGGGNQYHELAQLFTAYFAKHVHGITDNDPNAHNMRVIVFDKHDRSQNTAFDQFYNKAFTQKGAEAYEDLPAGTCFRRSILVYPATRSIFWITFGHKPPCSRYPLLEGFQRFMLRGLTGSAAVATPKQRTMCFIIRGSRDSRKLRGEGEFIDKLRRANPSARIVSGALGEGALQEFKAQFEWISQCTILTGTHGAGLTHSLFLPEEAIVVELHTPGHGTFRGISKGLGHTFIHLETHDETQGNYPAWGRALRSAWQASNNFYHMHENSEFNLPGDL